ncbi:MAG: GNAT family N-acetyltransferase [Candidatus Rifleibacteriota bacterium]
MQQEIVIRSPETDEEFAGYYHVRWQTLRAPWGEPEGSEKDERDNETFHLAAFIGNKIVGVGRIQKNTPTEAQIRYMGILEEYRRMGIARRIVQSLEKAAIDKGFDYIVLDARQNAVGFYIIAGYEVIEESYLLFDSIQHYRMRKNLKS